MAKKKKTKVTTAKKKTKRKVAKKTVKKAKRRGRPRGSKTRTKKKRGRVGRPRKTVSASSITLPVGTKVDIGFWSDVVVFLNKNKGKTFIVQMDGVRYSLNSL